MAAPIRRAGMPGRLEPLGRREQRPGVTSVQAVSPARPVGQGPAVGRVSQLGRPGQAGRAGCDPQQEIFLARQIRARGLVAGLRPGQIAEKIHDECGPAARTSWIRAHRLALGISLADVVAQVRAWYVSEGRTVPRFSETLLSAYESGQKRPGPEYLHYLCAVYRADPPDLGYPDPCFCGRGHGAQRAARAPAGPGAAEAAGAGWAPGHPTAALGYPAAGPEGGQGPARPGQVGLAGGQGQPGQRRRTGQPWQESRPDQPWQASQLSPLAAGGHLPAGPLEALRIAETGPEDDDDVVRRTLLRLIADPAVAVDGQFFGAVDRIRRRMDDALMSGTVSAIMLDECEEATAGYGRQYMTVPPLRLLCDVLLDFGDVRRMSERRQPLEFGQRLCRLAGRLAGLIGMVMINVGDQRLARSYFRTARTAADETGDRDLRAWVAVREALVPLYYGDPAEASALARAGAGLAGRSPCAAAVMGPVLEARALAWAAARREDASGSALRRTRTLLG